jgi:hypothetical protein
MLLIALAGIVLAGYGAGTVFPGVLYLIAAELGGHARAEALRLGGV